MARYDISDVEYPGVTEVTGQIGSPDGFMKWAAQCAVDYIGDNLSCLTADTFRHAVMAYKTVSDDAKDIGTIVHDMIEAHAKGEDIGHSEDPQVIRAFQAFLSWEGEHIEKYILIEQTLHDPELCFAGRVDCVAEMTDGRRLVIDWKTSSGIRDGYDLQVAAYRWLCEGAGYAIDGQAVLRLDKKTGLPEWKEFKEYKIDAFLTLLDFFYLYKKRRLKNNRRVK